MGLNPQFELEKYNIGIEEIITEAAQLLKQSQQDAERKGLFLVKTANQWIEQAKIRPIPGMLFGEFWYEEEVCILFADTNLGKSILAVQIADSISKGEPLKGFQLEVVRQPVLYFDFELSDKQFENRYSRNFQDHYLFDENFIRIEINSEATIPDKQSFEDYLNYSMELSIKETGARILIIDNLTYLKNETEKAKDAMPLMKHLQALKRKYNLSILALAHTPKRDLFRPISKNDVQGSKTLMNFCDSSFAIGESSRDKSMRYIKQIKVRFCEYIYDTGNVCVCQIQKPDNFLGFELLSYGNELEHLKQMNKEDKDNIIEQVKELSRQGKSQRQIAAELSISLGAVNKYLNK